MGWLSNLFGKSSTSGHAGFATLGEIEPLLTGLLSGENVDGFFGLISAESGCLYINLEDGRFYLDIEVFNEHDLQYLESFKEWAAVRGSAVEQTTYGNPNENGKPNAPVFRIDAGDSVTKANELVADYFEKAYGLSSDHTFDVVP